MKIFMKYQIILTLQIHECNVVVVLMYLYNLLKIKSTKRRLKEKKPMVTGIEIS